MSLLEDIFNQKRKNTNVKTKTEKFIDIYSVRKNLVSTKNVLDLIETNKKKFQKFDYQIENIEERSIDIVVKVNSNRTFEVYDLILFIKKELSEYNSSFKNRNPIQNSNEEWINLSKNNIKYNFSYLLNYIFIFIGVIITNIILNVIDQKIYTINRSRFLLNREFDFILNVHNSNSIQKKLFQIINYNLESDKIIFLIINSNKYLLEQIKKYQNSNNLKKIILMNIESIGKIKDSDNSMSIIFITGYGLHNTKEILELRTFLNNNYINKKSKTIYLSRRLGFL